METIYDFITKGEAEYQKPISLEDGWSWSMKDHLRASFLYKNFQFLKNNDNRTLRPFKNIILAILNVQYRTEGFDVKDIEIYVNDADEYYKSFLVKKFHEKWALENFIDTFIDDLVESYCDYGGVLVRDTASSRPEVVDLRSIAFCNQTDILAYPFGIKHSYSPSQLREMELWGKTENGANTSIEDLLVLCKDEKEIFVYEVVGTLPTEWLNNNEATQEDEKKDTQQIQIVAFYKKEDGNEQGVTLFKKKLPKLPFKFLARDKIIGRALGRGGVEELFEDQKWTNWDEIKITEMLEAASKMIVLTSDSTIAAKHPSGLKDMDNMEFLTASAGTDTRVLDTYPRNLAVFNDAMERRQAHAQQLGSASDPLLGETPNSGTPFKLYEAQQIESKSMHRYRQGKIATFMDEIYRDWILPHITKELVNDQNFLAELSADEMKNIADNMEIKETNREKVKRVLTKKEDEILTEDEFGMIGQQAKEAFLKGGNKRFIKILKNEIKKSLSVMTNIAGKQKNLALLTDKLVNVMRQFIATPQIRQDPEMIKLLNVILESSGLSPIMFNTSPVMAQPQQGGTEPLNQLSQANQQTI